MGDVEGTPGMVQRRILENENAPERAVLILLCTDVCQQHVLKMVRRFHHLKHDFRSTRIQKFNR